MVSPAWHLVTFALPQRCIWRVGGRRTGGKKRKREKRRGEKTRVKEFNCRLSNLFEPISWLIWWQGGWGVMFNEVVTCHLFPNSSFTQVAPFNGALMEPKFAAYQTGSHSPLWRTELQSGAYSLRRFVWDGRLCRCPRLWSWTDRLCRVVTAARGLSGAF